MISSHTNILYIEFTFSHAFILYDFVLQLNCTLTKMEEGCLSYSGSSKLPPPTKHDHHPEIWSRPKHSSSVITSWSHFLWKSNLYRRRQ